MGFYQKNEKTAQHYTAALIMEIVIISPTSHLETVHVNFDCKLQGGM